MPAFVRIMIHFIVNPASRSGKGKTIWEMTEASLKGEKIRYECHMLSAPGEAKQVAHALTEDTEKKTCVVVGGDGTINEFVSGLQHFSGITLGYLPTGSGNDFARGMRLPTKPEEAIAMLLHPKKTRRINIGKTVSGDAERCFAISSGIGYDAAVCYEVDHARLKRVLNAVRLGKLIYLVKALQIMIRIKPFPAALMLDGQEAASYQKVIFAAAMNTRYEGGGFDFSPDADPSDDQLDLILAEGIPKWKVLFILPTALFGKHTHFHGIHIHTCTSAALKVQSEGTDQTGCSDQGQCIHTDGEHFGFRNEVAFSLCPEKLKLIVR